MERIEKYIFWLTGADPNKKDKENKTALDIATQHQLANFVQLLDRWMARNVPTKQTETLFPDALPTNLSGWLVKQGGREGNKGWNKRYCTLTVGTEDAFQYFRTIGQKEPCGSIRALDILDVTMSSDIAPVVFGVPGSWPYVFGMLLGSC